jgi:hypothetical protein
LERQVGGPSQKLAEPFSVRAEQRRQQVRGKHRHQRTPRKKGGRKTTAQKLARAARTERVLPAGLPATDCRLSHTRPVWRLENGRAVLVAYEIYRGPNRQFGKIPGVLGRSEFGIEVVLAIAYQVYVAGLGRGIRSALPVVGEFARRADRRDRLEHPQRVGVPLGKGARGAFRRPQGCGDACGTARPGESERTLRSAAQARVTCRTSKTVLGARRRTVIESVLESLRMHLSTFTLWAVIEEVGHWLDAGRSCFSRLAENLGLPPAVSRDDSGASLLDRVLPVPSG